MKASRASLAFLFVSAAGCGAADRVASAPTPVSAPASASASAPASAPATASASASAPAPAPAPTRSPTLTLLLGGDVELARATGRKLLANPAYDPFATLRPELEHADVRFVNLEGPLSDQRGETMSPRNSLIFTGPPVGAEALARARITLVSTANNHAWDYGRSGLLETIANLDRAGVAHAGTGATLDAARAPTVVEVSGWRIGLVAVTDVFNFGPLAGHEAAEYLARADPAAVAASVATARARGADVVVVSVHVGDEYVEQPLVRTRALMHAMVDAGADVVAGHHPHVAQGAEWYAGKPIFYSLGNVLMQMHSDHPATGYGYFARVTFEAGGAAHVDACPHRILGLSAIPLADDPHAGALEGYFFAHLRDLDRLIGPSGARVGSPGPDGCADLTP